MSNKARKVKKEDFLDYLAKNKLPNQTQIAEHFNINKRTILRWFQAYNLPRELLSKTPMPTSVTPSLQIKILTCYKFNKNIKDICKETGVSKYLVKKTLDKLKEIS
jgi:DNA-binding MarR family transcriptional regulator